MTVADATPLTLDGAWTVEAWIRSPDRGSTGELLRFNTGAAIVWDELGVVAIEQSRATFDTGFSFADRRPDCWHHLALVVSGTGRDADGSFYVDGRPSATSLRVMQRAGNGSDDAPFLMGGQLVSIADGCTVAELRIWGVSLGAEELAMNARSRLTGNEPGLVAYFPFDGTTQDRSATQLALTAGTTNWVPCAAPIGNLGTNVWHLDDEPMRLAGAAALNTEGTVEAWVRFPLNADPPQTRPGLVSSVGKPDPRPHIRALLRTFRFGPARRDDRAALVLQVPGNDFTIDYPVDGAWHHVWVTWDSHGRVRLGVDDQSGEFTSDQVSQMHHPPELGLEGGVDASELRIWSSARDVEDLRAHRNQRLTGAIDGLLWRHALDDAPTEDDVVGGSFTASVAYTTTLPVGPLTAVSGEYPTYGIEPDTGRQISILRRFTAVTTGASIDVLAEQRVDELELAWIGNAQYEPTLLGYIEGAPPVPSENLTIDPASYQGASAIELVQTDGLELRWGQSRESGTADSGQGFVGLDDEWRVSGGVGVELEKRGSSWRLGYAHEWDVRSSDSAESSVGAQSALVSRNRLELRGQVEDVPQFANLGVRFVPKNVGYALVVSTLADVFVMRLRRSQRMVGYRTAPVPDVEPDVNIITFMMNPGYTMTGSLDGFTGSRPASDRWYGHVPALRAQYGSLVPASSYRVDDAYRIKERIRRQDKVREAYFSNFMLWTYRDHYDRKAFDAGVVAVDAPTTDQEVVNGKLDDIQSRTAEIHQHLLGQKANADAVERQRSEERNSDPRVWDNNNARRKYADWQIKMNDLLQRAGKRNIVNTYVWDADGGLHIEAEDFASTIEHTIGTHTSSAHANGADMMLNVGGVHGELKALASSFLSATYTKTHTTTRAVGLEVSLDGVERAGVTDGSDLPLLPGEKVDRYRFMSFFLEGSSEHFDDFFTEVVDLEWLRSNDEEARALRQVQAASPGKPWRVLHRVTSVERPALHQFGRDLRPVPIPIIDDPGHDRTDERSLESSASSQS